MPVILLLGAISNTSGSVMHLSSVQFKHFSGSEKVRLFNLGTLFLIINRFNEGLSLEESKREAFKA